MFEQFMKYAPLIAVLIGVAAFGLYLRNRNRLRTLAGVAPARPMAAPLPPMARVVRQNRPAALDHLAALSQTVEAQTAVQEEQTLDQINALLDLEKRKAEKRKMRERLGLSKRAPDTTNALMGHWDDQERDKGPMTQKLDNLETAIAELRKEREALKK